MVDLNTHQVLGIGTVRCLRFESDTDWRLRFRSKCYLFAVRNCCLVVAIDSDLGSGASASRSAQSAVGVVLVIVIAIGLKTAVIVASHFAQVFAVIALVAVGPVVATDF